MTGRSILITGSSGMIGTALAERLLTDEYDVYGADIDQNPWIEDVNSSTELVDLRERDQLDRLPADIDTVVHLAAHSHVRPLVEKSGRAMENLSMTHNVLEFVRENDVPHVIFASSREVYGSTRRVVHRESDARPDRCESPYGASKIGGEALVSSFAQCYGITTSIARFSNVYGRFDTSTRVIPLFIALASNGDDLTVYGAEKMLDFVYLDDCVDALRRMIDTPEKVVNETVNVASGNGTSLVELAREVTDRTPNESTVGVEPSRTGETNRYVANIDRTNRILGYRPEYDLRDGLDETVSWYLDRPSILEKLRSSIRK